jgi:RNA polymerase sigma-70 factor (ECF subfamily)
MKPSRKHPTPTEAPPERRGELVRWPDVEVDDTELVRRCVEGDQWARGALYHRYAGDVANLALRLLRDKVEANDVLQDTFVTAFETTGKLREPARVRSWLRTIAVRHVQRRFRRRRLRRLLGFRPAPQPLEELAAEESSQEAVAQLRRVDAVLRTLPDRARTVWTLRVLEGETLPAIAELCGISLATVKRDLASAQDEIRGAIDDTEVRSC